MPQNILVASPHPAFGELLRLSLEETGEYHARLVLSGKEALAVVSHAAFDLALLDGDLKDEPIASIVRVIMEQLPEIKVMVFPPENNPRHPLLMGLRPHATLEKPFYLPDLLSLVEKLLPPLSPHVAVTEGALLGTGLEIQDMPDAGSLEKQPTAAVSLPYPVAASFDSGSKSAAAALAHSVDELPWLQDAIQARQVLNQLLAETTAQAALILQQGELWISGGSFSPLDVEDAAFAVHQHGDKLKKSSLMRYIRLDSGEFLTFSSPLVEEMLLVMIYEVSTPLSRVRSQTGKVVRALATPPPPEPEPVEDLFVEDDLVGPSLTEEERNAILALLADMPSPDPDADADLAGEWIPETNLPSWAEAGMAAALPVIEADPAVEQTRPTGLHGQIEAIKVHKFDPSTLSIKLVPYTGTLIPGFEEHYLTGELSLLLGQWMPELCTAFGWRLERLSIRPAYLQWTVRVLPAVTPGSMERSLREQTSLRIFQELPTLVAQNPTGDFWAPGCLIVSGTNPPPADLLRDYIDNTRRRQGDSFRQQSKER